MHSDPYHGGGGRRRLHGHGALIEIVHDFGLHPQKSDLLQRFQTFDPISVGSGRFEHRFL
jgi:hypothetical protein